jgi:hypothetical protein
MKISIADCDKYNMHEFIAITGYPIEMNYKCEFLFGTIHKCQVCGLYAFSGNSDQRIKFGKKSIVLYTAEDTPWVESIDEISMHI